jgi:hypothetical protein
MNFISSEGVTPQSSLVRAHVSLPLGSLLLRHLASFEESLQVVLSPCCPRELPDVISANLSSDAWSRTPAVPRSAHTCFFLHAIGLPPEWSGSASRFVPRITTSRGFSFRGCRHFITFRPPSLLVSQIVPTAAHTAAGQPRLLHPGRTCFVTSTRTGYASRPNTGN